MFGNRSVLWARLEQWVPALEDAEASVELRPDWSRAYACKGAALEVSIIAHRYCHRTREHVTEMWGSEHVTCKQGLERLEEAKFAFEQALMLDANNEALEEMLADLELKMMSRPEEIENSAREIKESAEESAPAMNEPAPEIEESTPEIEEAEPETDAPIILLKPKKLKVQTTESEVVILMMISF